MKLLFVKKYMEFIALGSVVVALFFAQVGVLGNVLYAALASMVGIYFFPVKLFLNLESRKKALVSGLIITWVLSLSVLRLFNTSNILKTVAITSSLVNFSFVIFLVLGDKKGVDRKTLVNHMVLLIGLF